MATLFGESCAFIRYHSLEDVNHLNIIEPLDFHAKVKDKIEASLKDSPGHDLLFIELAQRIETQGVPGPERQPLKGDREKVYHYHYHYSYYY